MVWSEMLVVSNTIKVTFTPATVESIVAAFTPPIERGVAWAADYASGLVIKAIGINQAKKPRVSAYSTDFNAKTGKFEMSGGKYYYVGLNPSKPGEPPHVLSGRLRMSIRYKVKSTTHAVIGYVGTNVEYARRLELGFFGTDSQGHNIQQEPRPFLRSTMLSNAVNIMKVFRMGLNG